MKCEILDLDGALPNQVALRDSNPTIHLLQEWGPKVRMGCSFGRYRRFEAAVPRSAEPRLAFLGSGDFHHVTLALIRQIETPFHLAIVDKHPDWVRRMPVMHCGTWVAHALKLPNLRNVYHFGGDLDFDNSYRHLAPWDALKGGRIKVFPSHRRYATGAWPQIVHTPLRRDPEVECTAAELSELTAPLAAELAEYPLYVSLDKDALRAEDAAVNWDSGRLALAELERLLRVLFESTPKGLVGADILGDWSPVTMSGPLRKFLDWSEHPKLAVELVAAAALNGAVNRRLIELFRPAFGRSSGLHSHNYLNLE